MVIQENYGMGVAVGEILRNGVLFDMKNWGNRDNEAEILQIAADIKARIQRLQAHKESLDNGS